MQFLCGFCTLCEVFYTCCSSVAVQCSVTGIYTSCSCPPWGSPLTYDCMKRVCWFWGRWIQLYWPVTTMSCHLIGREGGTVNADLFGRGTTITSPVHDWYKDSLKLKSARCIWHLRLQSKKDYDAALQANNLQYQKRGQDACLKMGMFFPRGQIVSPVSGLIFNVLLLCCMISVFLLLQQKVSGLVLNPPFIK